jgi:hypothetical protein
MVANGIVKCNYKQMEKLTMSIKENINWEEIRETSVSELAKKTGNSDIAAVFERSSAMSDVFSSLGDPHFQERANVNGSYTMVWFASDGWIHLSGTGKGYGNNACINLSDISPSNLVLKWGNVTSEAPKGYRLHQRQENPWGMMQWVDWDHTDDVFYSMWKEYVND